MGLGGPISQTSKTVPAPPTYVHPGSAAVAPPYVTCNVLGVDAPEGAIPRNRRQTGNRVTRDNQDLFGECI